MHAPHCTARSQQSSKSMAIVQHHLLLVTATLLMAGASVISECRNSTAGPAPMSKHRSAQLLALWDSHLASEFAHKNPEEALETLTTDVIVLGVATLTGGVLREGVLNFYKKYFIPQIPADLISEPLGRTIGRDLQEVDTIWDEFVLHFTHDIVMDWILPGVQPTGKHVDVAFAVKVQFEGDKVKSERLYWDQATVLKQVGLLPESLCIVPGAEQAKAVININNVPPGGLNQHASF